MKKIFVLGFIVALLLPVLASAQFASDSSSAIKENNNPYRPKRVALVAGTEAAVFAGTMSLLYGVWYHENLQGAFHWFNDNKGWLNVDKTGHMFTAYTEAIWAYRAMRWAGMKNKAAAWYGFSAGMTLQLTIETMDAFSREYGASWGDLTANTAGSALMLGQQLAWGEQRIKMKFSFLNSPYAEWRPHYFGEQTQERFLRDYNGHTYWLSAGPRMFFPNSKWPRWLNIAAGYGADGMLAEFQNPTYDYHSRWDLPHYERQRQWYLSLDVDLTQIKTRKKWLKAILPYVNLIKIPAPALEFNRTRGVVLHGLYF